MSEPITEKDLERLAKAALNTMRQQALLELLAKAKERACTANCNPAEFILLSDLEQIVKDLLGEA